MRSETILINMPSPYRELALAALRRAKTEIPLYSQSHSWDSGYTQRCSRAGLIATQNDRCFPFQHAVGSAVIDSDGVEEDTTIVSWFLCARCQSDDLPQAISDARLQAGLSDCSVSSLSKLMQLIESALDEDEIECLSEALLFADILVQLTNATRVNEREEGSAEDVARHWLTKAILSLETEKTVPFEALIASTVRGFSEIVLESNPVLREPVGLTGISELIFNQGISSELLHKLEDQNCRVVAPYYIDYLRHYSLNHSYLDDSRTALFSGLERAIAKLNPTLRASLHETAYFRKCSIMLPEAFSSLEEQAEAFLNKEHFEGPGPLIASHISNYCKHSIRGVIVSLPFGCLSAHIIYKGAHRTILENYPSVILATVEHDQGISETSQLNRIQLMIDWLQRGYDKDEHIY